MIKVLAELDSSGAPLLGLHRATSCCALTTTFLCVLLPGDPFFLYKDSLLYQGPSLVTSYILSFLCKGPLSKYNHIGG